MHCTLRMVENTLHIHVDTSGLQSSLAVVELNGTITVSCTFATGSSSTTGCRVTLFMMDSSQEVFSRNIDRTDGVSEVYNILHDITNFIS